MCYVNYVREHMAFIEFASDKKMNGNERTFWYALIHIANRRVNGSDWPEDFISIPNSRLLAYVPFSENRIPEIRNRLKQLGLIDFKPGDKNKRAPEYQIHYLSKELSTGFEQSAESYPRNGGNFRSNSGGNFRSNSGGNFRNNSGSCNRNINVNLNDTPNRKPSVCEDDDDDAEECARMRAREEILRREFLASTGRVIMPTESKMILAAWNNTQTDDGVAREAIATAALYGAKAPARYAARLIYDWADQGVKTIGDLAGLRLDGAIREG